MNDKFNTSTPILRPTYARSRGGGGDGGGGAVRSQLEALGHQSLGQTGAVLA